MQGIKGINPVNPENLHPIRGVIEHLGGVVDKLTFVGMAHDKKPRRKGATSITAEHLSTHGF
jgi:hypothetical protein